MPNHVDNILRVEGASEEVAAFVAAVSGDGPFDCDKIIPYPANLRAMDDAAHEWDKKAREPGGPPRPMDGFNSGGYEWCIENWGTKWGAYDAMLDHRGGLATYTFQSAWGPPIKAIRAAAKQYPSLAFELNYFERGMEFCGTFAAWFTDEDDDKPGEYVEVDERHPYHGRRGG